MKTAADIARQQIPASIPVQPERIPLPSRDGGDMTSHDARLGDKGDDPLPGPADGDFHQAESNNPFGEGNGLPELPPSLGRESVTARAGASSPLPSGARSTTATPRWHNRNHVFREGLKDLREGVRSFFAQASNKIETFVSNHGAGVLLAFGFFLLVALGGMGYLLASTSRQVSAVPGSSQMALVVKQVLPRAVSTLERAVALLKSVNDAVLQQGAKIDANNATLQQELDAAKKDLQGKIDKLSQQVGTPAGTESDPNFVKNLLKRMDKADEEMQAIHPPTSG